MGLLILCGSARSLWRDLSYLEGVNATYATANVGGVFLPHPITHWFSLHPNYFPYWREWRRLLGYNSDYTTYGHEDVAGVDVVMPSYSYRGSSGYYAVSCLRRMGYERILLAGMPITTEPHFFDPRVINNMYAKMDRGGNVNAEALARK